MSDENSWSPCPEGELDRLACDLRRADRRKMLKAAGAASAAVVLSGVGIFAVSSTFSGDKALTCAEVQPLLPAYVGGGLTTEAKSKVASHLEECPQCRRRYEAML